MVNSGSRIIWDGTMIPARNSSMTGRLSRQRISCRAKPAALPSRITRASAGSTAVTLFRM